MLDRGRAVGADDRRREAPRAGIAGLAREAEPDRVVGWRGLLRRYFARAVVSRRGRSGGGHHSLRGSASCDATRGQIALRCTTLPRYASAPSRRGQDVVGETREQNVGARSSRYEDGIARPGPSSSCGSATPPTAPGLRPDARPCRRGRAWFLRAASRWRESWEHATPTSWGRPIGAIKAMLLAGSTTRRQLSPNGRSASERSMPRGRSGGTPRCSRCSCSSETGGPHGGLGAAGRRRFPG